MRLRGRFHWPTSVDESAFRLRRAGGEARAEMEDRRGGGAGAMEAVGQVIFACRREMKYPNLFLFA